MHVRWRTSKLPGNISYIWVQVRIGVWLNVIMSISTNSTEDYIRHFNTRIKNWYFVLLFVIALTTHKHWHGVIHYSPLTRNVLRTRYLEVSNTLLLLRNTSCLSLVACRTRGLDGKGDFAWLLFSALDVGQLRSLASLSLCIAFARRRRSRRRAWGPCTARTAWKTPSTLVTPWNAQTGRLYYSTTTFFTIANFASFIWI